MDMQYRIVHIRKDAISRLIHSILNPLRILDNLLCFGHLLANRIIEPGGTRYSASSQPKVVLKSMVSLFFIPSEFIVKTIKHIWDLPLGWVKNFIVDPIVHFLSSAKEMYKNRNKNVLITTVQELNSINCLPRTIIYISDSHLNDADVLSNKDFEYIGVSAGMFPNVFVGIEVSPDPYVDDDLQIEPTRLAAIRGTPIEIAKIKKQIYLIIKRKENEGKKGEAYTRGALIGAF